MNSLIDRIKSTLHKNGFPLNKVSLNLEKIKEECKKKSIKLEDLIENF